MTIQQFSTRLFSVLGILLFPLYSAMAAPTNEQIATPDEVFVVYNSSYVTDSNSDGVQDSLEIAEYYKNKRSIPNANVVGVAMPTTQDISRDDYNTYIKAGIESALTNAGLEDTIKYLVVVKGVPMKIQDTGHVSVNYSNINGNYASVDSSLTLLYQTYSTTSTHRNPYYMHYYLGDSFDHILNMDYRFKANFFVDGDYNAGLILPEPNGQTLKYLVTRLDAYTVVDVKSMIDRAYDADTTGLGYFILDNYSGGYGFSLVEGDTVSNLDILNKNVYPNPFVTESTNITTAPGPVIGYTSHGTYSVLPSDYYTSTLDFTYLNGAVTNTHESFSAFSMTPPDTTGHGQLAQFIESGGSGGIGNVYEPYSLAIAQEEIWMPAYAAGYTWADAAYMSLRYIDWTTVVLGDPLMMIVDDTTDPVISTVTAVTTPTRDTTPEYTFSTTKAGTISYGGSCSSATTSATVGSNTITFSALSSGTYSNCTITIADYSGNVSDVFSMDTFTIDAVAPVISTVTAVTTPTNDTTPDFVFTTNKAGTASYGGSCTKDSHSVTTGSNTVTFNNGVGTYSNCTITVTDSLGNVSNILAIPSFVIVSDSVNPIISTVTAVTTPTTDTTPDFTFTTNEAGSILYGGFCSSATTSAIVGSNTITFNTLSSGTYICNIRVVDYANNISNTLTIPSFVILDITAPVISAVTAVTTPTTDTTPNFTFTTDEAGTISYGGSCSSATTSATVGSNTITFNTLSSGTYSNCTITITDSAENASNVLAVPSFVIEDAPVVSSGGGGGGGSSSGGGGSPNTIKPATFDIVEVLSLIKMNKITEAKALIDKYTNALNNPKTLALSSKTTPTTNKIQKVTSTLKINTKSEDVKILQEYLNTTLKLNLKPDGVFGKNTKNAVIQFQKSKGLTPDGIVGPKTKLAMQSFDINKGCLVVPTSTNNC